MRYSDLVPEFLVWFRRHTFTDSFTLFRDHSDQIAGQAVGLHRDGLKRARTFMVRCSWPHTLQQCCPMYVTTYTPSRCFKYIIYFKYIKVGN